MEHGAREHQLNQTFLSVERMAPGLDGPTIAPATLSALLPCPELTGIRRGIEKESLRIAPDGNLSARAHPHELGSPLTHPNITTDFSEAQLELITAVHDTPDACIAQLNDIHRFVYASLEDELLWVASMPCILGDEASIPVGRYGSSNIGMAKTVYRRGLGHRYGRLMQTISGIHYNFSLPDAFWNRYAAIRGHPANRDFITECYFGLIRNFRRHSWLLTLLFGASPAVCRSFARNARHGLAGLDEGTLYLPHATSLRMGRLGYQSDAQSGLHISYNSLDSYARTMHEALTKSYPPYEAIGVKVRGRYRQLNTALLQIENEFYGTIRPKRRIQTGERPLTALNRRGVEYVEVRCLDINPFLRVGIDERQIRFLDTFLLCCLLADSPDDSPEESAAIQAMQLAVVERGREPGLRLGGELRDNRARAILGQCALVAELLDRAHGTGLYTDAVEQQRARTQNSSLTPSARILDVMAGQKAPFFRFALNQSIAHKGYFDEHPPTRRELARQQALAQRSFADQATIEARDKVGFDSFLESYLKPPL